MRMVVYVVVRPGEETTVPPAPRALDAAMARRLKRMLLTDLFMTVFGAAGLAPLLTRGG